MVKVEDNYGGQTNLVYGTYAHWPSRPYHAHYSGRPEGQFIQSFQLQQMNNNNNNNFRMWAGHYRYHHINHILMVNNIGPNKQQKTIAK